MRVANLRSAHPGATSAHSAAPQSAAGSFFEALAGASRQATQASASSVSAISRFASANDSDAGSGNEQIDSGSIANGTASNRNPILQSGANPSNLQGAPASNATSAVQSGAAASETSRAASQTTAPQLSSRELAARIAAAVALPVMQSLPVSTPAIAIAALLAPAAESAVQPGAFATDAQDNKVEAHASLSPSAVSRTEAQQQKEPAKHDAENSRTEEAPIGESNDAAVSESSANAESASASAQNAASYAISALPVAAASTANLPDLASLAGAQPSTKFAEPVTLKPSGSSSPDSAGRSSGSSSPLLPTDSSAAVAGAVGTTTQHVQTDPSPSVAVTARAGDSASGPSQTVINQPSVHPAAAAATRPDPATGSAGSAPERAQSQHPIASQDAEGSQSSAINTAQLVQTMSQSEMRVGMHSAEFGAISIRTAVTAQQMTAQISVDHSDLGKAISAHLPAMQDKLAGDSGVRTVIEVNHGSMSFSGERGHSAPGQNKPGTTSAIAQHISASVVTDSPATQHAIGPTAVSAASGRLDIRA